MVRLPEVALPLGRLLGEDVALVGVAALVLAGSGLPEALGRRPIGLDLGHWGVRSKSVTGPGGGSRHAFRPALAGRKPLIRYGSRRVLYCMKQPRTSRGRALCRPRRAKTMFFLRFFSGFLLRRDHHHHLAAFQARPRLDDDVFAKIGLDALGHLLAQFLVAHLAATEADVDLDLVALFQEAAHVAQLDLVVALVGDGAELHFLDFDLLLLLLRSRRLLLRLELELAEVHDPAHRRIGVRLDLHEIHAFVLGHPQRFVAREDADHFAVAADHAHAGHADFAVLSILLFGRADVAISNVG